MHPALDSLLAWGGTNPDNKHAWPAFRSMASAWWLISSLKSWSFQRKKYKGRLSIFCSLESRGKAIWQTKKWYRCFRIVYHRFRRQKGQKMVLIWPLFDDLKFNDPATHSFGNNGRQRSIETQSFMRTMGERIVRFCFGWEWATLAITSAFGDKKM